MRNALILLAIASVFLMLSIRIVTYDTSVEELFPVYAQEPDPEALEPIVMPIIVEPIPGLERLLTQVIGYYIPRGDLSLLAAVTFVPALPMARSGHTCGLYYIETRTILLSEQYPCLAVLIDTILHELGHGVCVLRYGDTSELCAHQYRADRVRLAGVTCGP